MPQVDLMNFKAEYVRPRSGRCLGREAAERATKSNKTKGFSESLGGGVWSLLTTVYISFQRFPKIFQNCSEGKTNVSEHFSEISEDF